MLFSPGEKQLELYLTSDLVGEQWSDVVEELQLFLQGVTALLGDVHDVKNRRPQVSQSGDGLHLDGVPLLQGVVQDTRGVHHLHTHRVKMRMTTVTAGKCGIIAHV